MIWDAIKLFAGGALGFVSPLLAAVPARAWLIIAGVVAVCIALLFWNHHERAIGEARNAAAIVTLNKALGAKQGELEQAQALNHTCDGSITRLELDKQACELGRRVDQAAQTSALAVHSANEAQLKRDAGAARKKLADALVGRCSAWANLPACGVDP